MISNMTQSQLYLKTITRHSESWEESVTTQNGHYKIALPWKNYPPNLPNNKTQAENRLQLLKKRLNKNPELLEKYRIYE
jgi:hypothetical protein